MMRITWAGDETKRMIVLKIIKKIQFKFLGHTIK